MGSSGGNAIGYWRQLLHLRNSLVKSYPLISSESVQNNIVSLLRITGKSKVNNFENEKTLSKKDQRDDKTLPKDVTVPSSSRKYY